MVVLVSVSSVPSSSPRFFSAFTLSLCAAVLPPPEPAATIQTPHRFSSQPSPSEPRHAEISVFFIALAHRPVVQWVTKSTDVPLSSAHTLKSFMASGEKRRE